MFINLFVRYVVVCVTFVINLFLHFTRGAQKDRFLKRLQDPNKHWKFSLADISERSKWQDYLKAYEEMLNNTSTEWAPWYVIPADKKWVTHASISEILVSQIGKLHLMYPVLGNEQKAALDEARRKLKKE